MDNATFLAILGCRLVKSRTTLNAKGKIYSTENDRLGNFKSTGRMNDCTPADALWGMVSKHITAVKDQVKSGKIPTQEWMDEYLGDIQNYMILLEAIWGEMPAESSPVLVGSERTWEETPEKLDFLDVEKPSAPIPDIQKEFHFDK